MKPDMIHRLVETAGIKSPAAIRKRECGECSACCRVLKIPELSKPAGTSCSKLGLTGGCSIYADRPGSCRAFECLWLKGLLREDEKPNRLGVVFGSTAENDEVVAYPVDGLTLSAHAREVVKRISKFLLVITVSGNQRRVYGPPEKLKALLDRATGKAKSEDGPEAAAPVPNS